LKVKQVKPVLLADHKGPRDHKGSLVRQVILEDHKDHKVLQVQMDLMVMMVKTAPLVQMGLPGMMV
jgi:hypothetical protein